MNEEIPYLPVRTVVKFYDNHEPLNSNKLMTKTLLKAAFIDNDWKDKSPDIEPKNGEFWLVNVVKETCPGQPRGCFLVHPIRQVDAGNLNRLLPGMYVERDFNGCMILEPKNIGNYSEEIHWILPLRHKKAIQSIYAIIVSH